MPPRGRLPKRPDYADLPVWPHNSDDVPTRVVNAAWNALFEQDFENVSFKALAKEIGVTPPAIYHHCPSLSSLGAMLASRACATLHSEITTQTSPWEPPRPKSLEQVIAQYVRFAEKRSRHLALMFSPSFDPRHYPSVAGERMRLGRAVCDLLEVELGGEASIEELHVFWGLIHGSACLIASGMRPEPRHLLIACQSYLATLRSTPRSGAPAPEGSA